MKDGFTPLSYAALENRRDIVDLLLIVNANTESISGEVSRSNLDGKSGSLILNIVL